MSHAASDTLRPGRQVLFRKLLILIVGLGLVLVAVSTPPAHGESGDGAVSGVISDGSGDPIAGAVAELCAFTDNGTDSAGVSASDDQGKFNFTGVEDGKYSIHFRDPLSNVRNGTRFFISSWLGGNVAKGEACWQNPDRGADTVTVVGGDDHPGLQGVLTEGGRVIGFTKDPLGALVDMVGFGYDLPNGFDGREFSGWPSPGEMRTEVLTPGTQGIRIGVETLQVDVSAGEVTTVDGTQASLILETRGRLEIDAPRRDWVDHPNLGVGTVLKFPLKWLHAGVTSTYVWTRDGEPIEGADDAWYALTPEDAGHVIDVSATGTLDGHDPVTVETRAPINFKERSSSIEFELTPPSAPKESPQVIHVVAHVNMDDGSVPQGKVIVWDDSQAEWYGWHINFVSGRPNERGDLLLPFPAETFPRGDVYAEFIPDDEAGVNGSFSEIHTYNLT